MVFPLVCPSPNRPTDHTAIGRRRLSNALDIMAGWNAVTLLYFIVHVCFSSAVVVSVVAVSASTTTWRLLRRRSFLLSTETATTTKHYHYYPRQKFSLPHHIWRKKCTGQFQYYNYTAARCRRMLLDLRCGSDTHKEEEEEEEAIINESTIGDDGTKNNKEAIIIAAVNVATATTAVMNVAYDENDDDDASSSEQQEVANTIHTVMIDEEGKESYNNSNSSVEDEEAEDKANVTAQKHQQLLLQQLQLATTNKRTEAKILHDCGKLHDAAVAYSDAVVLLDEIILLTSLAASTFDDDDDDVVVNNNNTMAIVDRATCKLHEALCLLKDGRPKECLTACTNILVDQQGGDNDSINMQYHSSSSSSSSNTNNILLPAQIRGRAYHRRAKAKLAIYDINGALDDAHSGAFLGDKNAVQLYGKLMRQQQRSSSNDGDGLSKDLSSSILHNLLSSSGTGSSSSSSIWDNQLIRESLAEVLMGEKEDKMDMNKSQQRRKKRNTHNGGSTSCSSTNDSLVKSIATSLMKHIEDEDTQRTICNIIQSTNSQQVLQYASMAGIPMKMETASKLMSIANGITPKTIHNSLSRIKIGYSIIMTVRQVFKLIDDNKSIIIVIVLLFWLRNAFVEPVIRLTK